MGLLIEGVISRGFIFREGVSPYYLQVHKEKLSYPYGIHPGKSALVVGEIIEIKPRFRELTDEERKLFQSLKGRRLEFHLECLYIGSYDYLYLTENSWKYVRDFGILPDEYVLTIRLTKIKINGKEMAIYPYRDIRG